MILFVACQKFGKCSPEGVCGYEFRWRSIDIHCTQPATEFLPYERGMIQAKMKKQSMSNAPQRNVHRVGSHFSSYGVAVFRGLAMKVLVPCEALKRNHCFHPEMVAVSADDVQSLFERYLDLLSIAVCQNYFDGIHGQNCR